MTVQVDVVHEKFRTRQSFHDLATTEWGVSEWVEEPGEKWFEGVTVFHTRARPDAELRQVIYPERFEGVTEGAGLEPLETEYGMTFVTPEWRTSKSGYTWWNATSYQVWFKTLGVYATWEATPEKWLFPASAWPQWISHAARGVLLTASNPAMREYLRSIFAHLQDLARGLPESIVEESELWADESSDGSVHLEWIFQNLRLGFTVGLPIDEAHWHMVSRTDDGPRLEHGLVSESIWAELASRLKRLYSEML